MDSPSTTLAARFEITHRRFLDAGGEATRPLPAFAAEPGALVALYRGMVLTRAFVDM